MSISRRHPTDENASSDDEENTFEDFNPKLRMIGKVNSNKNQYDHILYLL